jgi:hypothetical protein
METRTVLPQSRISRALRSAVSLAKSKRNYVEDLAVNYDSGLSRLTHRRPRLLWAFVFGVIATALIWIAALRFPYAASGILSNGFNSNLPSRYNTVLTVLVMSIPFVPPFISSFALGTLLFPSPPEPEITSGVMSTFEYSQNSNKRYTIFIAAGMFGALNCILLLIAIASTTEK